MWFLKPPEARGVTNRNAARPTEHLSFLPFLTMQQTLQRPSGSYRLPPYKLYESRCYLENALERNKQLIKARQQSQLTITP